jgi:hypothetical protein
MIQDIRKCGTCGSKQAAEVPVKRCACDSDHARDVRLQLQAARDSVNDDSLKECAA